jgi:DNA polymerase-3 subunit epsilon
MTGGQVALDLGAAPAARAAADGARRRDAGRPALRVVRADEDELRAHAQRLAAIELASDGHCVWLKSL